MKFSIVGLLALFVLFGCSTKKDHQVFDIFKAENTLTIDGKANESIWQKTQWRPLDQLWLGNPYSAEDFSGRYKLSWREDGLYLLVEITDDVLFDQHKDPLTLWWDDDCVEVFIDENNSGGDHQFNHNAFAYHVAMDGNVVDMAPNKEGKLYNDHVNMAKTQDGKVTTWELLIRIFDDSYQDDKENTPVVLSANKKIGFALAYCDNDTSETRENFIGSVFVPGEDKNRGWIDAGIFGTIVLKE